MVKPRFLTLAVLASLCLVICDAQSRRRQRTTTTTTRRPQGCGAIPVVVNGQGLGAGNAVSYACQPGYRLEGTNVITCIDGRWTVAPRCVRQLCPQPPSIPFANPPQVLAGGVQVVYQCIAGYRIVAGNGVTSQSVFCNQETQSWSSLPSCEAIPVQTCGAPPSILNGVSTVSGNVATYTCNVGYIRSPGTPNQISCVGTQWSTTTSPGCVQDPSTIPPPTKCTRCPPAGGATIFRPEVADVYDVGSKITYTCIPGYRITGSNNNSVKTFVSSCLSDGTWTPVPTCEPVDCGIPPSGINTNMVASSTIKYQGTYTYTCLPQFETGSPTTIICQADGTFSNPAPSCTRKVCKFNTLPVLSNGAPYGVASNVDIPVGSSVTFQCNSQYRVAPSTPGTTNQLQSISCQDSGTFSALQQSCVYVFPSSCADYYRRDRLCSTGLAATVAIDTDGPVATNSPVTVSCSISGTSVCTNVPVITGSSTTSPAACTGTSFGTVFSFTAALTLVSCTTTSVGYSLSTSQLSNLITSSNNCRQKVSIRCSNAAGYFTFIRRNGETVGKAYNSASVGVATGDLTLPNTLLPDDVCDCQPTGACGTASSYCICSRITGIPPTATGEDSITKVLTGATTPPFVVEYGIARKGGLQATDYSVTVGGVDCCETC